VWRPISSVASRNGRAERIHPAPRRADVALRCRDAARRPIGLLLVALSVSSAPPCFLTCRANCSPACSRFSAGAAAPIIEPRHLCDRNPRQAIRLKFEVAGSALRCGATCADLAWRLSRRGALTGPAEPPAREISHGLSLCGPSPHKRLVHTCAPELRPSRAFGQLEPPPVGCAVDQPSQDEIRANERFRVSRSAERRRDA